MEKLRKRSESLKPFLFALRTRGMTVLSYVPKSPINRKVHRFGLNNIRHYLRVGGKETYRKRRAEKELIENVPPPLDAPGIENLLSYILYPISER